MQHVPLIDATSAARPDDEPENNDLVDEAGVYVRALRAAGAVVTPIRGTPRPKKLDPEGSFTIETPDDLTARRVAAVVRRFAKRRGADAAADGWVAKFLFEEAAAARFAAEVGDDLVLALRTLARRQHARTTAGRHESETVDWGRWAEGDPATIAALQAAAIADDEYDGAFRHVLAMPIRRIEDIGLKAQFALRFCNWDDERQKVLGDIAVFCAPEVAGCLPDRPAN